MPFMKRSDDAYDASDAHRTRDGTDRTASRREMEGLAPARVAHVKREAEGLLVELYEATRGLGDAINRAGFAPARWDTSEARLSAVSDRLPTVTVEALLARVADFALEAGPLWLAGGGEALDAFVHEVRVLAATVGPLSTLAQHQRTLASAAVRGRRSLKHALNDERVRAQLNQLAHTLDALLELTPVLEPIQSLPPASPAARSAPPLQASTAMSTLAPREMPGEREGSAALPRWPFGQRGQTAQDQDADAPSGVRMSLRWPGIRLLRVVWSRRRARRGVGVGIGLATLVIVLALSGTLTLLHALSSVPHPGPAGRIQAVATTTHGGSATSSPVRTAPAAASTQTPGPAPAALAVRPGNVVLPCGGATVALTLKNTGGQRLNWQASVSGNASLSAASGAVDPSSQATVIVHATGTQHGPGAIVFTSNGGTVKVTFKVSCR
jgi:hypothetical protein